jgi:hypothetical protein
MINPGDTLFNHVTGEELGWCVATAPVSLSDSSSALRAGIAGSCSRYFASVDSDARDARYLCQEGGFGSGWHDDTAEENDARWLP